MFKAKAISTYVYGIFAYDIPQGIAIYDFFGGKHHFKFFNMQLRTVAVKESSDFTRNLDEIIAREKIISGIDNRVADALNRPLSLGAQP